MVKQLQVALYALGISIFCTAVFLLGQQIISCRPHCDIDSAAYLSQATALAQDGCYCNDDSQTLPYYGMGYPLFLAGIFKWLRSASALIVLLQLILSIINFFIIRSIAIRLFSRRAGYIAFLLGCSSLGYIVFTQFILTEILLATFLTASFLVMLRPQNSCHAVTAAIFLGLSLFIKPAALYLAAPLFLLWLVWNRKNAILFFCIFMLGISGLKLHNYVAFGTVAIGNLASINLCYWYYPYFLAQKKGTHHLDERIALMQKTSGMYKPDKIFPQLVADVCKKPLLAALCWAFNMMKTMLGLYSTNMKVLIGSATSGSVSFFNTTGSLLQKAHAYIANGSHQRWVVLVCFFEIIMLSLCYCFGLLGLWLLWLDREKRYYFLLVCIYGAYFIGITGHDGCARFRMMIEFLLLSCAAGGIDYLLPYKKIFRIK